MENVVNANCQIWSWRLKHIENQSRKIYFLEYGFIPTTYILPKDRKLLKDNFGHETFIVKPAASARGIGIKVNFYFIGIWDFTLDRFDP